MAAVAPWMARVAGTTIIRQHRQVQAVTILKNPILTTNRLSTIWHHNNNNNCNNCNPHHNINSTNYKRKLNNNHNQSHPNPNNATRTCGVQTDVAATPAAPAAATIRPTEDQPTMDTDTATISATATSSSICSISAATAAVEATIHGPTRIVIETIGSAAPIVAAVAAPAAAVDGTLATRVAPVSSCRHGSTNIGELRDR